MEPMIVGTKYHFMPFPYSQTISRGYGSFVCQTKLWEICLMMLYGVLIGLHVRELVWYRDVDLQSSVYDNHLEASIFYTQLRVIFLGLLSTFTLFEFMVWISKVYRTTAVLFMVVEEVRSLLSMLPYSFAVSNECFFFPSPRPPFTDVQPCVQVSFSCCSRSLRS